MICNILGVLCLIIGSTYGDGLSKKQDILVIMASHEGVGMFDMIVEKQLLTDIISTLSVSECGQRVALMNYGSTPRVIWDFSSEIARNRNLIEEGISAVDQIGGAQESLVPVLNMATNQIFNSRQNRASAPDLTIFIISTASNSTEGLKDAVKALKDYSTVLVIWVTSAPNKNEVKVIADFQVAVGDFSNITATIDAIAGYGECNKECRPGFTDVSVGISNRLTGYIYGRRTKKTEFNFEDVLRSDKSLEIPAGHKVYIMGDMGFYVAKLCLETQFVKTIKIKYLDKGNNVVGKRVESVGGDGSAMTEKCFIQGGPPQGVSNTTNTRMSFIPSDSHSGGIVIQNLDVLACTS